MRALVTGGLGFAGSHLCEYLDGRGIDVVALANPSDRHTHPPSVRVVTADIRSPRQVRDVLRAERPDRIYHLAAFATPSQGFPDPEAIHDVNVCGTGYVCDAALDVVPEARVLYVSSGEVYGDVRREDLPLREDHPLAPANPYAETKADGETVVLQFQRNHELDAVIVRSFNHTGPRQAANFLCPAIAQQVAAATNGGSTTIRVGNLDVARDFSDVRDIVAGYELVMEHGATGEIYNLASGKATPARWIAETLCSFSPVTVKLEVDPALVRPACPASIAGDAGKAKALGWSPRYQLEDTLRDLYAYWSTPRAASA